MNAPANDHLRLITIAFLKFIESQGLPMPMASSVSEAIKPEVGALVEENCRLLADGMEVDFEGKPSIYGKAIAQAVRDAIRGDES